MRAMAVHGTTGRARPTVLGATPWRFLRAWLLVVAAAFVIGTLGYMAIGGWSLSDAFYMTAITLTTVGFREVRELDEPLRIWTSLVAIAGVGIIFGTVGIITEELVRDATSGRREAKRVQDELAGMRDHFVLCGYGRVGSTVARELAHDGQRMVVGGWMEARILDAITGQPVTPPLQHTRLVYSARFSPDGRWLALGNYQNDQVRVYALADGRQILGDQDGADAREQRVMHPAALTVAVDDPPPIWSRPSKVSVRFTSGMSTVWLIEAHLARYLRTATACPGEG